MSLNNEILHCIHERRSTRQFTGEQISPEQLDALLDAAIWAPSGINSQSWLFTAVQKKETLLHLNELVREGFQHWVPDDDYAGNLRAIREHTQKEGYCFYYGAPTLIIASNRPNYANAVADCACALQNLFLAAQSLGLGSCYINQPHWLQNDKPIRAYLAGIGISEEHTICASAAVGYIQTPSPSPARKEGTVKIIC
ncbi:MAG: nitroreductase [Clostridiales bacterium]|jgi:nitroreductase|nr:nitroreductase [Clostridiales bacterium]